MTGRFVYCGWFRDLTKNPNDQDCEWPACFIVAASTADEALRWGDHLSESYSKRRGTEVFLRGEVENAEVANGDLSQLPIVSAGDEASDAEIGW
jgi:hypothetical protein